MPDITSQFVDVAAWVDSNRTDPVAHRRRQAQHIVLNAIAALHPSYSLYLKGGLLLGLVHQSPRMTIDVDLTAGFPAQAHIDETVHEVLNDALQPAADRLGYVGAQVEVERVQTRPRGMDIEEADFPALRIWILYVSGPAGRRKEDRVRLDVSFSEPALHRADVVDIGNGIELHTYSLVDVIAEKYRALLQQVVRRRTRRQDVYDLDHLLARYSYDVATRREILMTMRDKCRARCIEADVHSLDDPEIRARVEGEWEKIALETGVLPEFDQCFEAVRRFYRALPWDESG